MISLLLIMLLLHIVDDFVMQSACLNNLKCKDWWLKNVKGEEYQKCRNDYKMALLIHGMSWSLTIMLPFIIYVLAVYGATFCGIGWALIPVFLVNTGIHCYVDNLKANRKKNKFDSRSKYTHCTSDSDVVVDCLFDILN